jgi:hypothetical protein
LVVAWVLLVIFLSCLPSGNRQQPVAGDVGLPTALHHALHPHSSQPEFIVPKEKISDLKGENQFLSTESLHEWSLERDLYIGF